MAENEITGANDVELVLESKEDDGGTVSTSEGIGRIVVDDFSITVEDGSEAVSGVGQSKPAAAVSGDETYGWSFTLLGTDKSVFDMISQGDGTAKWFAFTARKTDEDGNILFEVSIDWAKRTSGEFSGSSGDATEYAVEGFALRYDRDSTAEI